MIKLFGAQRTTKVSPMLDLEPTEDSVEERPPITKVELDVVDGKLASTTMPNGFTPDHIAVQTNISLNKRVLPEAPSTPYIDTVKVTDGGGNQVYPTSEIATGLGVTDATNISRMDTKLKDMTYRGTDQPIYTKGTDYEDISSADSMLIRQAVKSIETSVTTVTPGGNVLTTSATGISTTVEPVTGVTGNVSSSPITVWSAQATVRIATTANTLQGEAFAASVYDHYLETGGGNLDMIENIVETNNRITPNTVLAAPGMSRVSDAVKESDHALTRKQCNSLGRVAKLMSVREKSPIGKATSVFSNTTVNTYDEELLRAARKAVLDDK